MQEPARLYTKPLQSSRSGILYHTFPYPTKISAESIAVSIACSTRPGDTVLDAGAAQNAGTHFAAVLGGTTPAEAFARFHPDHISPDLWDLVRWLGL